MTTATISVISNLKEFALPRLNDNEYTRYKELVQEKNEEKIHFIVKEFFYFYERFLGFGSNVMHHVNDSEKMFIMSDFYLPLSKLKLILEEDFLPSTSSEALSNLFLVFSETNLKSYILGLNLLFKELNPLQPILEVIDDVNLDEETVNYFKKIAKYLLKSEVLLDGLQELFEDVSFSEQMKIKKDMCLLVDTFNLFMKELVVSEQKYKLNY